MRHQLAKIGLVENSPLKKKKKSNILETCISFGKTITLISSFGRMGLPTYRTVQIMCAGLLSAIIMSLPSHAAQGLECFANQSGLNVLRRSERRGKALFVCERLSTTMQKDTQV